MATKLDPGPRPARVGAGPIRTSWLALGLILTAGLVSVCFHSVTADTTNGGGTARVLTAISVTASQDLSFGFVYPGIAKVIGNDDDDSTAVFTVTGEADAGVVFEMVLPEYLALADGSDRMIVLFDDDDCSVDTTGSAGPSTVVGAFVDIDPRAIPTGVVIGAGGMTKLFLGGKVVPSANQSSGAYSGDLVLSVTYDGT